MKVEDLYQFDTPRYLSALLVPTMQASDGNDSSYTERHVKSSPETYYPSPSSQSGQHLFSHVPWTCQVLQTPPSSSSGQTARSQRSRYGLTEPITASTPAWAIATHQGSCQTASLPPSVGNVYFTPVSSERFCSLPSQSPPGLQCPPYEPINTQHTPLCTYDSTPILSHQYPQTIGSRLFSSQNQPQSRRVSEECQSGSSEEEREDEEVKGRAHPCPVCAKRFTRPSALRTHMHVHTGERPFVCGWDGCKRDFSVQSNCKRHIRQTHEAKLARQKIEAEEAAIREGSFYPMGQQPQKKPLLSIPQPLSDASQALQCMTSQPFSSFSLYTGYSNTALKSAPGQGASRRDSIVDRSARRSRNGPY